MAFNQLIADYVCEQLALGRGLRTIARDEPGKTRALEGIDRMPNESTLRQWAIDDPMLGARYSRARLLGNESDFEQMDEWSGETPSMLENGAIDPGWVAWNKLRINTRQWGLAKRQPGRYGDKVEHEVVGNADKPVVFSWQQKPAE